MSKINLVLIGIVLLLVGAGSSYALTMSGNHNEAYLKETAEMMKDDSKMMKEMYEMMKMNGEMMGMKGTQYNDAELTTAGKTFVDKSKKMGEMGEEMVKRSGKLMEMME